MTVMNQPLVKSTLSYIKRGRIFFRDGMVICDLHHPFHTTHIEMLIGE